VKAAVYYETGGPEVLRYEDVAKPACQPGGVLIDVEAISIERGDTLNRRGGPMTLTPHIVFSSSEASQAAAQRFPRTHPRTLT
jgi:NADPH2:quinone reductase